MPVLTRDLAAPAPTESRSSRHNDHSSLRGVILPAPDYHRKSGSNCARPGQVRSDDRQPNGSGAAAGPLRRHARGTSEQALTAAGQRPRPAGHSSRRSDRTSRIQPLSAHRVVRWVGSQGRRVASGANGPLWGSHRVLVWGLRQPPPRVDMCRLAPRLRSGSSLRGLTAEHGLGSHPPFWSGRLRSSTAVDTSRRRRRWA
jgi:hypothetical protein